MVRGRGEGGERRCGEVAIGARGTKVAARAMERGRGEGGERRCGVGAIGGRATKVAARAMERGHDEGGERRYQRCSSSAGGMTGIQWPPSRNQGTADDVIDAAAPAPTEPAQRRCARWRRKLAARAMERGRDEGSKRRSGVSAIGARATKMASRAMER